nr:hypothetical protein GCM10023233_00390 [Brevibacterium otitidis]BFF08605.1 hypothetical protein GCM10023233_35740 [Brevibacterium otitidis]
MTDRRGESAWSQISCRALAGVLALMGGTWLLSGGVSLGSLHVPHSPLFGWLLIVMGVLTLIATVLGLRRMRRGQGQR